MIPTSKPTLVVVSGPPGSGKTRLAHALARAIACPAVCRDEIKEGMVHAYASDFEPAAGDPLTRATFETFFDAVRLLLAGGVTLVAEAAFQDRLWRAGLERVSEPYELRIVHCEVDPAVARTRIAARRAAAEHSRRAHAEILDLEKLDERFATFERLSLSAPAMVVDTTADYSPGLDDIVAFVDRRA